MSENKDLSELMNKRVELNRRKYQLEMEIVQIESEIKKNQNEILHTCDHNWVRDSAYYGPYDKPDDICTICGSINYRY